MSCSPDTWFLDRDGTINRKAPEGDYVKSWPEFEFLPGALEALRILAHGGARVVVVTNQRGVALGRMSAADLADIHQRMRSAVGEAGGRIDAVYACTHDAGACDCRKPKEGLFRRAQAEFEAIDFACAAVVGDSPTDIEPGIRLGCATALIVANPTSLDDLRGRGMAPDHVVQSLLEAVQMLY